MGGAYNRKIGYWLKTQSEVVMIQGIVGPKRIDFFYNDDDTRDIELDREAEFPYYEAGDVIERRGRRWKVAQVLIQKPVSGPPADLTLIVCLTDKF
jgi:hypothetical protein